jgi:AcrR family transcriptional regulator
VTSDAILEAVDRVVLNRGIEGVTVRLVAKTAGVGMGSLYQFFPTREALLVAWEERVKGRAVAAGVEELSRLVHAGTPLDEIIASMVRFAFGVYRRIAKASGPSAGEGQLSRFSIRDGLALQLEQALVQALEHAGAKVVRPLPYALSARLLVRTVAYLAMDSALRPPEHPEAYIDELIEMIRLYLASDAVLAENQSRAHAAFRA